MGTAVNSTPITACMQDLNPAPFRGDAKIAHVNEDFFKMFFVGANVRTTPPPPPTPTPTPARQQLTGSTGGVTPCRDLAPARVCAAEA